MKRTRIYLASIAALLLVILIFSCVRLFKTNAAKSSSTIVSLAGEDIEKSISVPKKYPNGFPIEVLDYAETTAPGQRTFSGRCVWHPEADSLVGGKPAIVPVQIVAMDAATKTITTLRTVITRRQDGYFTATVPDTAKGAAYSIALRIERAANCPEKFKRPPAQKPKTI